jgi:hypothetical protein
MPAQPMILRRRKLRPAGRQFATAAAKHGSLAVRPSIGRPVWGMNRFTLPLKQ